MKFTPLDIQRREFEKSFRGLDEGEVRGFMLELAAEWEEIQAENQKLRTEILDLRDRIQQYQEQDRIFKETLLNAQKTREDVLNAANHEKSLIIREAQFKSEEVLRESQLRLSEIEIQIRNLKLERVRYLQDMDALLARSKRFLQEEAPELFPPADPTRKLDENEVATIDGLPGFRVRSGGKG